MNAALKMIISPEDYLIGEETSPIRYEYVDGEVYAMAGESKAHNTIATNLVVLLKTHLKGSPCRVYMENVKTHIKTQTTECFYYPDLQVSCSKDSLQKSHVETAPKLIIEVLSPSTERYDRTEKLYAYQQLESLEEYVLVAQHEQYVEIYRRQTQWQREIYQLEQPYLKSLDLTLSFEDIYENISF
jgi:Uma2 family endonuclease